MLLAVLTATTCFWVVLAFSRVNHHTPVAFTVDAPGLRLPSSSAEALLRATLTPASKAMATLVATEEGLSIGIAPLVAGEIADAEELAERLAESIRTTDWTPVNETAVNDAAARLYEIDLQIRDAAAQRRRYAVSGGGKQAAITNRHEVAAKVDRLLRERAEVLAAMQANPQLTSEVIVTELPQPVRIPFERPLALMMFFMLAAATSVRAYLAPPTRYFRSGQRLDQPQMSIRPPRGWNEKRREKRRRPLESKKGVSLTEGAHSR